MVDKKKNYKELPIGGLILDAGNSKNYKTGEWRSKRPIFHKDKCKNCLSCFVMCPDGAIVVKDGKVVEINYDFCKGCGICANQCNFNALEMKNEDEFE
jgi:pyruvate ferredoxin oxidoreductase delta subunit